MVAHCLPLMDGGALLCVFFLKELLLQQRGKVRQAGRPSENGSQKEDDTDRHSQTDRSSLGSARSLTHRLAKRE